MEIDIPDTIDVITVDSMIVCTNTISLIEKSIYTGSYFDIAMILHHLYKDKYVVTSIKNKVWFTYKDHKWVKTELGPYKELSVHIVNLFTEYRKSLTQIKKKLRNKRLCDKISKCEDIILLLNESVFKEKICKECLYIFYDDQFINKLDEATHLIPFKNGVYDMKLRNLRDGIYDDYLSIYINLYFSSDDDNDLLIRDFLLFRNEMISKRCRNLYKMYKLKNDYIV